MKQDQESWEMGYKDALNGLSVNQVSLRRFINHLSYMSGRVEGEAERKRRPKEE